MLQASAFSRSDALSLPWVARSVTQQSSPLSRRSFATVQHLVSGDGSTTARQGKSGKGKPPSIRQRLRKWDEENVTEAEAMLTDFAEMGELSNTFTRPQNVSMAQFEVDTPLFDGDELGELRSDDTVLKAGDMVELSAEGSRRPMLAICLGRINGYEQYYTSSGKWFSGLGVKTLFVVHGFAKPSELKSVIDELPSTETPVEAVNALQDLGHGPSRSIGAALLRKMLQFIQAAESVYQANAGTLDASSAFIGDPVKHRYLTLHEIADLLLPESDKVEGKFNAHSLYAVHRALLTDEVFFRPLKQTGHRRSYLFEVSPLSEVRIVQKVENMVREYMDQRSRNTQFQPKGAYILDKFIKTASKVIDESRKRRKWSNSGMIGPSSQPAPKPQNWSTEDREILQFMELWASYQKFPTFSRLQTMGSAILGAVDRYQEAQTLAPAAGWTFLQELAWIPPWEIPARYSVRFPDIEIKRGGGYIRPTVGTLDRHLKRDTLAPIRKELDGTTAYCIDAESAMDIDDAVSLERTTEPDQYWVHVHVADPASSIKAETPVAKYAELIPEAIYLPGHFERMLPDNLSKERFSLGPNRPCLTFSALVKTDGTVMDQKITPGILDNVKYITYEDAASAIGEVRDEPLMSGETISLGPAPKPQPANRKMTRPEELTEEQKDDLTLLSELGRAVQAGRLNKGATPIFAPRPVASAYFDGVQQEDIDGFISTVGDPSIRIGYSGRSATDLVENAMKLAGEVAARWCSERGIPIPYRTQPHAVRNAALVQQYARDVFNPLLAAGVRPDENQFRHMRSLLGSDELSTWPGPHFTLGADMYTKATSPLRRFSDLIVHWQIEAALLEERRLGRSLVGRNRNDNDDSFLPFSRERLDRMLPMLRVRERQTRALTNGDGTDQWILQALVRAWRFGEAALPPTFRFRVEHVFRRRSVLGRLDWFDRPAFLKPDALNDVLRMGDACVGDVYEVRLREVNVHAKQILVEAVRVVEKAADPLALVGEAAGGSGASRCGLNSQTDIYPLQTRDVRVHQS
ncbi:Uu.00g045630.m01.CDS01 [Anthostomella pinea]|uniref:Uu.00g045630.m01.CDS01 n=1 Tax=Anthostomella pinea TaxID=933095 RepID=A0AAI8VB76_9PEZI|nr:Uu.00g045630.m01.CDS01 [Anthostomella pinea]